MARRTVQLDYGAAQLIKSGPTAVALGNATSDVTRAQQMLTAAQARLTAAQAAHSACIRLCLTKQGETVQDSDPVTFTLHNDGTGSVEVGS